MESPLKKELGAEKVISIKHQGSYDKIGSVYHELFEWAEAHSAKTTGVGLTVFLGPPSEFNWQSALFEVCLPVGSPVQGDEKVTVRELSACTVASVMVEGPYSQIPARYSEMLAWISANGWEITGPPREAYVRGPDAAGEGDPSKFVTEIQFPINPESA